MSKATTPDVFIYEKIDWDRPLEAADPATRPPESLVKVARTQGARRKKVVEGQGGFFMNRSVLPAGFQIPPHAHDHDELLVVLSGGCQLDDGVTELGPDDSIVIRANFRYGFTCGPQGMEFLTIRAGQARTAL